MERVENRNSGRHEKKSSLKLFPSESKSFIYLSIFVTFGLTKESDNSL